MRLALLLAAALGVHADVQAPDMDPERKAEIAKKVREFQELDITNNEEIDEASMVLLGRAVANTPQLAYLSLHYQAPYGNGDGGTYPQLIELVRAYVAMQKSEEGDTDTLRAFAKAHGLDDSEYDAMSGEAPGGKQEASPGTADYRGSGKNGLPTFDELQRGAAKEMAARQSLEDDDYLPNLKNEL